MDKEKAHKLAIAVYALQLAVKDLTTRDLGKAPFAPIEFLEAVRDDRFAELVEAFKEIGE